MIPFLHIGRLAIPTFGLMVAAAMLGAYIVLRADLKRRGIGSNESDLAEKFIAFPCLAGIIGAKLYHLLESPHEFFADPLGLLFSPYGFAWFGGLIAGLLAFLYLAHSRKIPALEMLDAGSPAAAVGYGIGRIGCLLSGDGDYGIPTSLPWGMSFPNGLVPTTERVHPTPIYELLAACLIVLVVWRMGAWQITPASRHGAMIFKHKLPLSKETREEMQELQKIHQGRPILQRLRFRWVLTITSPPRGDVFAAYLVLTGAARFLVEFIRINPRSFFGLTNAQAASLASIILGVALWWQVTNRAHPGTAGQK